MQCNSTGDSLGQICQMCKMQIEKNKGIGSIKLHSIGEIHRQMWHYILKFLVLFAISCFSLLFSILFFCSYLQYWAELILPRERPKAVAFFQVFQKLRIALWTYSASTLHSWHVWIAEEQRGKEDAEVLLSQNRYLDSVSQLRNSLYAREKMSGIRPCSMITVGELNTHLCLIFSPLATWDQPFLSRRAGVGDFFARLKGIINFFLDSETWIGVSFYTCF